jgi:type IV pilus assembly protein PilC
MAIYSWEGKDAKGRSLKGEKEAATAQQVYLQLRAQGISPNAKKIKEKGVGLEREIKIPGFGPKVRMRDVVIFTRQFAVMVDAGLPLIQGLDVLAKGHENKAMRRTLSEVREHVAQGGTLADGMKNAPKAFDELYVNMVAAGEAGGILDIILGRLANYMEKADRIRRQVKTAMIYPAVVVFAAVIVTAILLVFVIPTFADMFKDFGAALPAPTRIVMSLSDFMVQYWYVIVLGFGSCFYFLRRFFATEKGKEVLHPLLLKAPVFGDILRKVAVARFSRTLSTMISSGVPILDALLICSRTAGNKVVEREVSGVRASISEGKSIAEPLQESVVFPPMVVSMIAVGESTGALDAMLGKVADFYEDEVENAVNAMKQLIEPIMILILGAIIGGLVVAMYLPIFKLGSVV